MVKSKRKGLTITIIVLMIAAAAGAFYMWLSPRQSTARSMASSDAEKVSSPFEYSGYSSPKYKSYTKQSEYVTMDDGTKIAIDIYLPADGPEDSGSYPCVFQFTPYGRAYTIPEDTSLVDKVKMRVGIGTSDSTMDRANSFDTVYGSSDRIVQTLLSCGYAYACADVRGTGASYGVKVDFMPEIATDGRQVIDWIADQSWSDGNVGMFGGSYLGYTQLVIAAEQPDALKCIFPEVVGFDGYSSEIRPGGVFVSLYSDEDIQTLYEMNNYLPDDYVYPTAPVVDEDGDGDLSDEIPLDLNGNGDFLDDYDYPDDPADEPQYKDGESRQHIYYLATYEHRGNLPYSSIGKMAKFMDTEAAYTVPTTGKEYSMTAYSVSPAANIDKIMESGIAVYNHGSWMDTFITGTTELYSTMRDTNPSKMVIDVGYHETESPFWEYFGLDEDEGIDAYAVELLRYYDHYLKGMDNGIDTEDPVWLYNMNGDGWRSEKEWPLARQTEETLYLADGNALSAEQGEGGSDDYTADLTHDSSWPSQWYDYDVSRYVMAAPDEVPDRTTKDEQCLTYTTSAFREDTEITGYPIADLWVSATSDDADLHIYLEDVDEEGNAVLVTEGVLRAGFAAEYDNDEMIEKGGVDVKPDLPWHGYEEAEYDADILAGGAVTEMRFEMFPTSWTFKEGHSLRLSIACADTPTFEQNPAVTGDTVLTLWRDADHPSQIKLPVIP